MPLQAATCWVMNRVVSRAGAAPAVRAAPGGDGGGPTGDRIGMTVGRAAVPWWSPYRGLDVGRRAPPPGERSGCGLGWAYQSRRRRDATVVCESLIPVLGVADGNVTSGVARDDARVFSGSVVVVSFSR